MPIKVSREPVHLPLPGCSLGPERCIFLLCRECSDQGVIGQIARDDLSVTETISYVDSYIDLCVE